MNSLFSFKAFRFLLKYSIAMANKKKRHWVTLSKPLSSIKWSRWFIIDDYRIIHSLNILLNLFGELLREALTLNNLLKINLLH